MLRVDGELDLESLPVLDDALAAALDGAPGVLVVDLSGVEFLAACGLRVLLQAHQRGCRRSQLRIVATGLPRRVLELGELDRVLPIFPDLAHALPRSG